MTKKIVLKDVARKAGVSYQTVSKVIRNQIQVSPEVRERVYAAIEELGYLPNAAAQNLRTRASRLIGYSWQQDRQYQFSSVLQEFQHSVVESAEDLGYHVLLFPQRHNRDLNTMYAEHVRTGRIDGFILSSVEYNDPRIPIIEALGVPAVCFGRADGDMPLPYVDVDGRAGIVTAVNHLIAQGHRRIAVLAWPETSRVGSERLAGYVDAMAAAGLEIDPRWLVRGAGETDYGYTAARELLALPEQRRPTAIVTLLDVIAIGAMRAVEDCGLRVGCDVAVTGFDDMPIIQYLKPGLTSLRQPVWQVGQRVVDLLVTLLQGETPPVRHIMLKPELIIRESSQGFVPDDAAPASGLAAGLDEVNMR